jgi:NitT/TauT family transport system ATP-binding protein
VSARVAAAIELRGVHQRFTRPDGRGPEVAALEGIDLSVGAGELVCVLGPSGCGKSTLLAAIAGFLTPTAGEVLALGRRVTGPGPERGMVFQEYALFPWMTVAQNIAFGLTIKHAPQPEVDARVAALVARLGLGGFEGCFPRELSGGMQQRVAIARVLALDAPILLMDEPFGALDALTRRNLQDELLRLWAELRTTIVFVTHSIEEALYLADRVVVMTYRPGTVKRVHPIELPRPRDPADPTFNALERELGRLVMEEQERHRRDERPPIR